MANQCAICGADINLIQTQKLSDGNCICRKNCRKKGFKVYDYVSGEERGYMKLFIPCGGADDPRPIKMRQRGSDGKWFLWEQYLLTGVRTPKAADPWA